MVNDNLDKLRAEDKISEQAYLDAKKQMNKETYSTIVSVASAAFSSMSGMMSAASAYSQACSDLEVAKIEKITINKSMPPATTLQRKRN